MSDERKNVDVREAVLNAASGYAAVVLGIVCFILALVVIAAIVRIVVGAGAGASV